MVHMGKACKGEVGERPRFENVTKINKNCSISTIFRSYRKIFLIFAGIIWSRKLSNMYQNYASVGDIRRVEPPATNFSVIFAGNRYKFLNIRNDFIFSTRNYYKISITFTS